MKNLKYFLFLFSVTGIAFGVLILFTINTTGSLPKGIYYNTFKEPVLNDIVLFCPPINDVVKYGYEHKFFKFSYLCPGNYQPLMKRVYALQNDNVIVTDEAVFINGKAINNTEYIHFLPPHLKTYFQGKLKENEYFLLSDYHTNSFDSRYFGIVHKNNIIKTIKPLILWR